MRGSRGAEDVGRGGGRNGRKKSGKVTGLGLGELAARAGGCRSAARLPRQRGRRLETQQSPSVTSKTQRAPARAPEPRDKETIKQSRGKFERVGAHPEGTPASAGTSAA